MRGAEQELAHTTSRRTGPRRWLRAVRWLIDAGYHPRANRTTMAVAEDLAARMDYGTGHARYCLDETAARLKVDRSTVKRHVAMLRELGALVWVVHGTKTNVRRALGMKGYAGTATIYAAAIPPVYDHAMGHRIIGTGYEARALATPPKPVDNPPVENRCAPPSLCLVDEEGQVQVVGGEEDTTRKRARRTASPSPSTQNKRSSSQGTARRSPAQVAREIRDTRLVRALVNWTQTERRLRRLAFVLRPLFDRGLTAQQIADELHGMCQGWRPARPAAYIRTVLAADAARSRALDAAEQTDGPLTADGDWAAPALPVPATGDGEEIAEGDLTLDLPAEDLAQMRLQAAQNPGLVRAWIATAGEDSARQLYGNRLVRLAQLETSTTIRLNPWRDATYA
ncbi:cell wall protein [Streptomyces sp. NPDC056069]|uniref:cell wall protein n=1 Tax=Streptomyces sp. NPDC056069 TaxID=3345702 RepID=UPI0035D8FF80